MPDRGYFDPHEASDFRVQIALLAQRVDALTREKEEIEAHAREQDVQIHKLKSMLSEEKMNKIDANIKAIDGMTFLGRWLWKGVVGMGVVIALAYTSIKLYKGT